jgi:hypothetical protein
MEKRSAILTLGLITLAASGCNHAGYAPPPREYPATPSTMPRTTALMATAYHEEAEEKSTAGTQRYIAKGHRIYIIATESDLQKSWEALVAFCGTIQCEIVSSEIHNSAEDAAPSGSVSLRVAPGDGTKLIAYASRLGNFAQHTINREDKTAPVLDTEAKIKNLTSFRDNLRNMLAKPTATVKDLIEIHQQLTEVQSQLDFEAAQRKILANETEKVAFDFSFQVERTFSNAGGLAQVWNALRQSSRVFGESIASLITVVAAILPWLLLTAPIIWLLRKVLRRVRRDRFATAPTAAI